MTLPGDLHAGFDAVRSAFAHAQAGRDDDARAALQTIGLQSPFLEWKVLLRGLLAWYAGDDAKARENWQRLDPERLPARIAAPFRARIDPTFRDAQPADAAVVLRAVTDRLVGSPILPHLRRIQAVLGKREDLHPAFREVGNTLPILKPQHPDLAARLGNVFYWAIVDHGQPEDVAAHKRTFGPPADDPAYARLNALVLEEISDFTSANKEWERFEGALVKAPGWTDADRSRARAAIWYRMGQNAHKQDDLIRSAEQLPPFLFVRFGRDRPKPLKPNAEACLRKAIDLAPDWVAPHEALFQHLSDEGNFAKAITVGQEALKQFPDHFPLMEGVAVLLLRAGEVPDAAELLERAYAGHPLDQHLRKQLGVARRRLGRYHTALSEFDAARAAFRSALEVLEPASRFTTHAQWAACEFRAGNAARAEELLKAAEADPLHGPALAALMLGEAGPLKLDKALKARYETAFKEQLAGRPSPAVAAALASLFARYRVENAIYHGAKTHEKNVLAYVDKTKTLAFTEPQMDLLGGALLMLQKPRALRAFARTWDRAHPASPFPPFFELESYLMKDDTDRWPVYQVQQLLKAALERAEKAPPGPRIEELKRLLEVRRDQMKALNPYGDNFTFSGDGDFDFEDEL